MAVVWKSIPLSEDIDLSVYGAGEHFHCVVALVVPESSVGFVLYRFVYADSWKVRVFKLDKEGRELADEEDAFFEFVDKLRESKGEEVI